MTLLGSCKEDVELPQTSPGSGNSDPLQPTANITTTVAGKVLDLAGNPLKDVRITVAGASVMTTSEGLFTLENISVPGNRCVIRAEKAGYFKGITAKVPFKGNLTLTRIILTSNAPTHTLDAATGGKAILPNGSEVQLPANGLVTASGSAYTGQVNLSVHYQDPSTDQFGALVAGGDLLAQRTDQSTSVLYSYGILRVQLKGSGGEDLQVAPGKTAAITVAIPEQQLATAPATIPLWYFNEEAGVWKEEGQATKQGNKYIGTVAHFTDWNADAPNEQAYIRGKIVDCEGNPIPNCPVQVGQIETQTGPDGVFIQRVPTGTTIHVTVTPFSNLFIGKMIAIVEPLSADEVENLGELRSDAEFCAAAAKGTIKTKSGDAVQSVVFQSNTGSMALYQPGNSFTAKLPQNTSITIKVYTTSGMVYTKTFQTTASKSVVDLGIIDLSDPGVKVSGLVACTNVPVAGATAKLVWSGGSATTTTDSYGFFEAFIPPGQQVTLTITHAKGTKTKTFQTSATGGSTQSIEITDLCATSTVAGENSFVITGDVFNTTYKKLTYEKDMSGANFDVNMVSPNTTVVNVTDQSDSLRVNLSFTGNSVGTVNPDTHPTGLIQRKLSNGTYINYFVNDMYPGSQITITVTRYDPIGGLVEGTYSGTFIGTGQTGKEVSVTVTNGKFSAVRGPDLKL